MLGENHFLIRIELRNVGQWCFSCKKYVPLFGNATCHPAVVRLRSHKFFRLRLKKTHFYVLRCDQAQAFRYFDRRLSSIVDEANMLINGRVYLVFMCCAEN